MKKRSGGRVALHPVARFAWLLAGCAVLGSCAPNQGWEDGMNPSSEHFLRATRPPAEIAPPRAGVAPGVTPGVTRSGATNPHGEGYSISVTDMPVRDLLFALARDAEMNIDIYPGISGRVTLSAINQSLPQILDRISKQVDLRYEITDDVIVVSPDRPYLKIYQVDYLNMTRSTQSTLKVSTQLSTRVNTEDTTNRNPLGEVEDNQSSTSLTNTSTNAFWTSLTNNVKQILGVRDPVKRSAEKQVAGKETAAATGKPEEDAAIQTTTVERGGDDTRAGIVAINPEAGVLSIFATFKQHEQIQTLLNSVLENAQRQVLIESTVVEVTLNRDFQSGVDWNNVVSGALDIASVSAPMVTNSLGGSIEDLPFFSVNVQTGSSGNSVDTTIRALEHFGDVKVLSSPKIMALNNQSSLLKVVENQVFFTLESTSVSTNTDTSSTTSSSDTTVTALYNTKVHTVPVGLVMAVTPQISADDTVSLNVRPTISSISQWVEDPNPGLQEGNSITNLDTAVSNQIPVIQVKEMESMLRIKSGQVAVMGGLMQDKLERDDNGLPGISRLPVIGDLFGYKERKLAKSELVIFIRPVVMTTGVPKIGPQGELAAAAARNPGQVSAGVDQMAGSYLDFTGQPGAVAPAGGVAGAAVPQLAAEEPVRGGKVITPEGKVVPNDGDAATAMAPAAGTPPAAVDLTRQVENDVSTLMLAGADSGTTALPAADAIPLVSSDATTAAGGKYFVDLGSYLKSQNADEIVQRASSSGMPIYQEEANVSGKLYLRVRSGPYASLGEAEAANVRIKSSAGLSGTVRTN